MQKEEFISFIKRRRSAPFLFLGSGFTKHYLETPTWEELLGKFSNGPINMYRSLLDTDDLSVIASKIAEEKIHDFWKTIKEIPNSDEHKYIDDVKGKNDYLKILISKYLTDITDKGVPEKYKDELDYLARLNIDGVITTNWDNLAEMIFSKFKVFTGQEDLIFSETFSIGEIYKIHGSVDKPKSLVLTKEDYDNFNSKNAYLASKLITIIVEHPIVFLGYSINDPNIQNLLDSIVACFDDDITKIEKFRDNLIFVEWTSAELTDILIDTHSLAVKGKTIPCIRILAHDFLPVYECLNFYEREIPAAVLRLYKEKFYNIVCSEKPEKQIYAIDAKDIDNNENVEFVCGFGAIQKYMSNVGYTGVTANQIFKDVVSESSSFLADKILLDVLPRLRKSSITNLPCYKYLAQLDIISMDTYRKNSLGINLNLMSLSDFQKYPSFGVDEKQKTLSQIDNDYQGDQRWKAFALIPYLDIDKLDLEELRKFLLRNINFLFSGQTKSSHKTSFRRAVCFYDWCKYGTWFTKGEMQ